MDNYELEKRFWTEQDFPKMGWHDCNIYKMRLSEDIEFDLDYILQWNKPDLEGLAFTFWVAPATLVFKNCTDLTFELNTVLNNTLEIDDIEKETIDNKTFWTIITQQGNIQFISTGFEQYIRQEPSFQFGQSISYDERNGYSLERTTNQDNPNKFKDEIVERRKKDFELYEMVKKRNFKKQEKAELKLSRENNDIDLKDYLLKKKEIEDYLFSYDFYLKGTHFEGW
jgi:hypothetical protein